MSVMTVNDKLNYKLERKKLEIKLKQSQLNCTPFIPLPYLVTITPLTFCYNINLPFTLTNNPVPTTTKYTTYSIQILNYNDVNKYTLYSTHNTKVYTPVIPRLTTNFCKNQT